MGWQRRKLGTVLLLGLAACSSKDEPVTQMGEFGQVAFSYGCAGPGDPVCDSACDSSANATLCQGRTFAQNVLPRLAVGSTFQLAADDPGVSLVPATTDRISPTGGGFEAVMPGLTAIMALLPSGEVKDLVDVEVREVAAVDVNFTAAFDALSGHFIGAARILLMADEQLPLGGFFPCQWSSSDPAIVAITSDATDNMVSFETGTPGTATLTAELGDYSGTVTVEVGQ
jgi:hypothetical protein